jgi:hypothetical protein
MTLKFTVPALCLSLFAAPALAQDWSISVEGGTFISSRDSTQEDIVANPLYGGYFGLAAARDFGALKVSIDGRAEFTGDQGQSDIDFTGPLHAGVLGLHLGTDVGNTYLGGFVATGFFDGYDHVRPMGGNMAGVTVAHAFSPKVDVTGQLGWAELLGDPGDNEYKGYVARIAVDAQLTDRLSGRIAVDAGRSEECFVDCSNEPGEFYGLSLALDYALNDRVTLLGGVDYLHVYDEDDNDTGTDTSLFLGARLALGAGGDTGRKITTPIQVYRVGGYMDSLD